MFLKEEKRKDKSGRYFNYRLCESFRDSLGFPQRREVLSLGRMDGFDWNDKKDFILLLDKKLRGENDIFARPCSEKVVELVGEVFSKLVALRKVDLPGMNYKADNGPDSFIKEQEKRFIVKACSLVHKDVREIGAEHLCLATMKKLMIDKALEKLGFSPDEMLLAMIQIAARAVHPASELATTKWIKERSQLGLLMGFDDTNLTKDNLYRSAEHLYQVKDGLKTHLSRWTKDLFKYDDSIILYDLTNTYFEGQMEDSEICDYGKSKEKRSDCKLIVLALVVNQNGFPKHYELFEGNMSDVKSLKLIIEDLDKHLRELDVKPAIVIDAGISTEDNLKMLREKNYEYLCVSRSSQKSYTPIAGSEVTVVKDNLGQSIELQTVEVLGDKSGDHYLWVRSQAKAAKENSMTEQFTKRFEAELQKIKDSLGKKHGVKKVGKVNERIGRAKQKYPSVSSHYEIIVMESDDKDKVEDLTWSLKQEYVNPNTAGVYFLRTNKNESDEKTLWYIYNILKEIESSFRCLKTDLDLRPVYHKTDKGCMAHLHLCILAYWVVASIRHQLKAKGITHNWKQIVEIMNTHKSVYSTMENLNKETVSIQKCSEPNQEVCAIYKATGTSDCPHKPIKSVGAQIQKEKKEGTDSQYFHSE